MNDRVITKADICHDFAAPRLVEAGWSKAPHAISEQRSFCNGRIITSGGKAHSGKHKSAESRPLHSIGISSPTRIISPPWPTCVCLLPATLAWTIVTAQDVCA